METNQSTTVEAIKEVKEPIPIYKCNKCSKHFEVPRSCLKTHEYQETVYYKVCVTKTYLGWECPNCSRINEKPSENEYSRW